MQNIGIKHFFGFLIGHNLYIAIVACMCALPGFILFKSQNILTCLLFTFFATLTSYNLQRYFKWYKSNIHGFLQPYVPQHNLQWLMLLFAGATVTFILTFKLQFTQIIFLACVGCVTFLYLFIHPAKGHLKGLRYVPFLKTFLVSGCWLLLFFALANSHQFLHQMRMQWAYWLVLWGEVWVSCVLFDLRDIEEDKKSIRTFANTYNKLFLVCFWLLINLLLLGFCTAYTHQFSALLLVVFITAVGMQTYAFAKKPNRLLFTVLVDGSLIAFALFNYLSFSPVYT